MRGPGLRLDLDVRREWTCPECRLQRRLPGEISIAYCPCREGGVMMQLTADPPVLRRAERLNPLPFLKRLPPPWWDNRESQRPPQEEPASEPIAAAVPESPPDPAVIPTHEPPSDDFGSELDIDEAEN